MVVAQHMIPRIGVSLSDSWMYCRLPSSSRNLATCSESASVWSYLHPRHPTLPSGPRRTYKYCSSLQWVVWVALSVLGKPVRVEASRGRGCHGPSVGVSVSARQVRRAETVFASLESRFVVLCSQRDGRHRPIA